MTFRRFLHNIIHNPRGLLLFLKWKCKVFFCEQLHKSKPNPDDCKLSDNVNLFYWKPSSGSENLGDYLSKVVVTHFMPEQTDSIPQKKVKTLLGIGSILGFRCQNAIVWGSGIMYEHTIFQDRLRYSHLDIRAVRGPKTRQQLLNIGKDCPEIYGDPAILMPLIFQPQNVTKKYPASVILHHTTRIPEFPYHLGCNPINVMTNDYETFITQILESSLVISSSLHGIILAEAYGVPAVLLSAPNQRLFKFEDWYHSTGRYDIVVANSIEEALSLKPMDLPNLQKLQHDILRAFPADLWQ